jgi:hypothetical protein
MIFTTNDPLDIVGKLLVCLLIGSLAGRTAKYFGAPMELRLLAFAALAGITLAIWHFGGSADKKASAG